MLGGFLAPTAGDITLLGQSGPEGLRMARAQMGALIERPIFWPYLSCRENLKCLQGVYGSDGGDDEIDRLLNLVNLDGDAAGRKFRACSTGMKQRLGIAATMLGDTSLLILDEPTNGLDPVGIIEVRELIRSLADPEGEGACRTVILASHLLNEVEQVCDRVGVMSKGRLLYSGPVSEMGGKSQVRIRTTDDKRAKVLLAEGGREILDKSDAGLDIALTPGTEWEISRDLAEGGIYLSEMKSTSGSLEAGFMEVTSEQEAER